LGIPVHVAQVDARGRRHQNGFPRRFAHRRVRSSRGKQPQESSRLQS
jgi:hypothetical protein